MSHSCTLLSRWTELDAIWQGHSCNNILDRGPGPPREGEIWGSDSELPVRKDSAYCQITLALLKFIHGCALPFFGGGDKLKIHCGVRDSLAPVSTFLRLMWLSDPSSAP